MLRSRMFIPTWVGALAGLVFFGYVRVWHILMLSFITGCAQAFGTKISDAIESVEAINTMLKRLGMFSIQKGGL